MTAAIASPEAQLSSIALMDNQSRAQIVESFNATEAAYPWGATLHNLFEKQAAVHPSRTCIVGAERAFTYRQVEEHANQVSTVPLSLTPQAGQRTTTHTCQLTVQDELAQPLCSVSSAACHQPPCAATSKVVCTTTAIQSDLSRPAQQQSHLP